jgi:hypothetical protein
MTEPNEKNLLKFLHQGKGNCKKLSDDRKMEDRKMLTFLLAGFRRSFAGQLRGIYRSQLITLAFS